VIGKPNSASLSASASQSLRQVVNFLSGEKTWRIAADAYLPARGLE
jgi:hypothetical protein